MSPPKFTAKTSYRSSHKSTNDDARKNALNGWDKIPDVIQQMILKLSVNDPPFTHGPRKEAKLDKDKDKDHPGGNKRFRITYLES